MPANELMWQPPLETINRSNLSRFCSKLAEKCQFRPSDYGQLHRWSVENQLEFWQFLAEFAGIRFTTSPRSVFELSPNAPMREVRWFPGAKINYARELLGDPNDEVAIISHTESAERVRAISRRQLWHDVAAIVSFLNAQGVRPGDRVAGVVANIYEAVVAMLATTSLGAIWSSCSPDFGRSAILDRFSQISPVVLFYTSAYVYGGKRFDCESKILEVAQNLPNLRQIVSIDHLHDRSTSLPANATDWASVSSSTVDESTPVPKISFFETDFDHPLFVMFSSGTTGIPKGIVHAAGRTLLQHKKELLLHVDLKPNERIFYFTTCGWMMWNWLVSALSCNSAVVLYDGAVTVPTSRYLWDFASEVGVNVFGTSPKYIQVCMNDAVKLSRRSLAKIDRILSTGSPLLPEHFDWIYSELGNRVQLSSISGGTDIISCFMLGNPWTPVRRGEIQAAGLGMDIAALDDNGVEVIGGKGELVCRSPFVSMPISFWNDTDGEKYRSAYFGKFSDRDIWCHGDYVEITPEGGIIVYGRSDATLNPGGVRIGTAEIYRVVEGIEGVDDSVAIGRKCSGDVEVILFVKGIFDDWQHTERAIRQEIRRQLSPRHVPARIYQVTQIPYTRSGKKVELAIASIFEGRAVTNVGALTNPEALDEFHRLARDLLTI